MIRVSGLTINGVDLGTHAFVLRDPDGMLSPPARTVQTAEVDAALAAAVISSDRRVGTRELAFKGVMWGDSVADLQAKLDGLTALLDSGELTVKGRYDTTRELLGYWVLAPIVGVHPTWVRGKATAEIRIVCPDGRYRASSATVVALTDGVAAACAQGSCPSEPEITITATGGCTNPTITLLNSADVVQETMALTLSLAAGDSVTINVGGRRGVVRKTVSAVTTSALDAITNHGAFPTHLRLDPRHGVSSKIKVALASGTATMQVSYHKRYW